MAAWHRQDDLAQHWGQRERTESTSENEECSLKTKSAVWPVVVTPREGKLRSREEAHLLSRSNLFCGKAVCFKSLKVSVSTFVSSHIFGGL